MASLAGLARRNLQSGNTTSSTMTQSYSMNGKIIISALAILFLIVIIILLLHVYAKWLRHRRSSTISSILNHSLSSPEAPLPAGTALDMEIVKALPIFTYEAPCLSKAKAAKAASAGADCAVCLSDFRQDETCKLLPKCKHFFHIECIDMWFLSNTTCPLCRTAADPHLDCGEVHALGGSMSFSFTKQDGGGEVLVEHSQRPIIDAPGTRL